MIKCSRKIFSCILVLTMLFSSISMFHISAATLEAKNGFLDIEAEKADYMKKNLSVKSDKMFSGGQGLSVNVEDKTEPAVDAVPDINLSFKADKQGAYTIWLRSTARQQNGSGNTIFLSINGEEYKHAKLGGEPGNPMWLSIGTVQASSAGATVSVRIKIRQRNDIVFDRFIITSDAKYKPNDAALGIASVAATATPSPLPSSSSPTSADPAISIKPAYTTNNGSVMIEAESVKYNTKNFSVVEGVEMSGGKGLAITNEDKTTPAITAEPDLNLSFTADKAGTYAVWVRNKSSASSSGASVFLSLQKSEYIYTALTGTPTEFAWTKLGSISLKAGEVGGVRLTRRQKNFIVLDKFVISNNKLYTPTDMGGDPNSMEVIKLPEDAFPKPTVTPPVEHPRLMFTSKDVATIKANLQSDQNKAAYDAWQKAIAAQTDGMLPEPPKAGATNYNANIITTIEALAFDYAINGNEENGRKAVLAMHNVAETIVFDKSELSYRYKGHVIFTISQVYDWCYALLSDTDKKELIAFGESYAKGLDIGYPPKEQGSVSGHGGENNLFRDLLSFGIATYNERPDIYNFCAGRLLAEHIPARNYMYTSNAHSQGNNYGHYRGGWEIWAAWLFKRMSGQDVFSADQQYFPYQWIYSRRPDGQALRIGDDFWEAGGRGTYWSGWSDALFLVSNYYNDPYLKREFARETPLMSVFSAPFSTFSPVTLLAFNNPELNGKPTTQLPLTKYFPSPQGMMIARTGWNDGKAAPDVMVEMNIGERYGANHAHLDSGHFQIYYKGILASDSGQYSDGYSSEHDANYNKRGIAHNILTIYDPDEKMMRGSKVMSNDGGLRYPADAIEPNTLEEWLTPTYETGKVLDHEFGPDPMKPEFAYIKGDITKAYSDKVSEVLRSMLFMPLEDKDHPAVMIIMDKVKSKNQAFKKSWLLHTQEEPVVEGNKTIVTRTQKGYNGRMVVETLLPKNPVIEKIGGEGKQFWIDGKNYAPKVLDASAGDSEAVGWGRIEVSPSAPSEVDYFLNVMTVSDADTKATDLVSTPIEGENYVGAVVSDRVALFSKEAARMGGDLKFTIPGSGIFKVFVSGIKEGTWTTGDGQEVIVTKDGGAAYFVADAGEVVLAYKNGSAIKSAIAPVIDDSDSVGIRIGKAFIYSDVKPVVVEGRTLIPMRVIFENLGSNVVWDDATKTATATKDGVEIKITEDSKIAYVAGEDKELDVAATIIDGRFVVPVRFVAESMGAKVTWDQVANLVDIAPGKMPAAIKPGKAKEGNATIVSSEWSSDETDIGYLSYDDNPDTYWAVNGVGSWITYAFDKEYTIKSVNINFYQGEKRSASFDLYYSMDGKEFKPVLEKGISNGKVDSQEYPLSAPITCKYIKFVGKGNTTNTWNSIKEIEFRTN